MDSQNLQNTNNANRQYKNLSLQSQQVAYGLRGEGLV